MKARTLIVPFIFSQWVQQCWSSVGHLYILDEYIDWRVKGTGIYCNELRMMPF